MCSRYQRLRQPRLQGRKVQVSGSIVLQYQLDTSLAKAAGAIVENDRLLLQRFQV